MIYIRRAHAPKGYNLFAEDDGSPWARMASNVDDDELIKFARTLGLKKAQLLLPGTEFAHYDLTRGQTDQALKRGAKALTANDFQRMTVQARKKAMRDAEQAAS